MKKYFKYILILFIGLTTSCEKVVDVDLDEAEPRLVIDAIIRWQKDTTGNEQIIKLSLTNNFYSSEILPANGATVTITDSANQVFEFLQVPNTENYICTNFTPQINETYTLEVHYNGEVYTATNKLIPTPSISNITQEINDSFGEEVIQVKFFFQDDASTVDYYLLGVINPNKQVPEFGVLDDEFSQGQELFGYYASSETEPGTTLYLSVQSSSYSFYDYMSKLITNASSDGNPFAVPTGTIRGNIVNQTDIDNYALGYFHLAEIDVVEYTVQ